MPQVVEISLRIPSLRVRSNDQDKPNLVDNSEVRFTRRVELASIPKPGHVLTMSDGDGRPFPCEVVQADWHEEKNIFVVACRYGKRTLSPDVYRAIAASREWTSKTLL